MSDRQMLAQPACGGSRLLSIVLAIVCTGCVAGVSAQVRLSDRLLPQPGSNISPAPFSGHCWGCIASSIRGAIGKVFLPCPTPPLCNGAGHMACSAGDPSGTYDRRLLIRLSN